MLDVCDMLLPNLQNSAATDTSVSSFSSVENVITTLQELFDNTESFKTSLRENSEAIRGEIKSAFERQHAALRQREDFLLQCLEETVVRQDESLDSRQQDVEQIMVDLEGYLALLHAKAESGVSKEKLQAWITSTLLQASNLCQSYADKDCLVFTCKDLSELIANFGNVSCGEDYKEENIAKGDMEDDSIAVVQDGQWLHSNSIVSLKANPKCQSTDDISVLSPQDDKSSCDEDSGQSWLVKSSDEEEMSCQTELTIETADKSAGDWLLTSTVNEVLQSKATDSESDWLVRSQSSTPSRQDSQPAEESSPREQDQWLCQSVCSSTDMTDSDLRSVCNQLESTEIFDISKWLQKSKIDDDMCKWLAGRSNNQCDSCSSSCPFESARFDLQGEKKKKWLATATDW